MSPQVPENSAEQLRADLKEVANQLCQAISGNLSFLVHTESNDPIVQQLEMLCNLVLDTARRKIAETDETLQKAADGIVTIDEGGVILSFNSMAETIFGYTAHEVIGGKVNMLMPSSYAVEHDSYLLRYLVHGEARIIGMRREVHGRRRDGTEFPLDLHVSEISCRPRRFSAIVRDLTEVKLKEAERQQLENLLSHARKLETVGELAAGIAHEINTPIQYVGDNTRFLQESFEDVLTAFEAVGGLAEALSKGGEGPVCGKRLKDALDVADVEYLADEVPRAIQQSLEGIDRVASIVGAMKEFSHPGGKEMEALDINRAIKNTITVARSEWKYVAEMVLDLDASLPAVPCLLGELNQVFLNLVVNASHAIADALRESEEEQGTIRICTRADEEFVEIRIEDSGAGIPLEVQDRIFDPFFTTKEVGKGTGQGLAIAHSVIVQKHGGTLTFETEPGKGTTFIIRLPLEVAAKEESAA